jgi:hypothetical protein
MQLIIGDRLKKMKLPLIYSTGNDVDLGQVLRKIPAAEIGWYTENIDSKVSPETRHLLETYSRIAPEEVLPHARAIVSNFLLC